MSSIERQINQARRRLTGNLLLERLSFGVLLAAGLWAVVIVVVQLVKPGLPLWHGAWMAAALAVLVGMIGASLARPSRLQAAVALDGAAGLKERLSTALLVQRLSDPFARAAVHDAEKSAGRVHVPSLIRYQPPRLWPWSAATVVAALLLAWLMPPLDLLANQSEPDSPFAQADLQAEQQAINVEFEKQAARIKELARDHPQLDEALGEIEPIELPEEPGVTPDDIRRKAVQRIDNVRDKLQRELEEAEEDALKATRRMLRELSNPGSVQANDQLAKSLAAGDFEGAQKALEEMAKDIEEAAKNAEEPAARQKLARMQRRLEQLASRLSELNDSVRIQKELENKAGLSKEDARRLMEQLARMDPKQIEKELQKQLGGKGLSQKQIQQLARKIKQQQKARKNCRNLSQCLQKAAQACQQCQSPGGASSGASQQAGNALSDAASQLSELEMSEQLINELEAQLSDLANMRQDVCQGNMCRNPGRGPGCWSNRIGSQGPNAGLGLGEHVGKRKVPYQRDPTKAKTRFQGGTIIGRMLVEGPQVRGEATSEELLAAAAEVRDEQDAVEREEVPSQYQKALRVYFERLAGLMTQRQKAVEDSSDK